MRRAAARGPTPAKDLRSAARVAGAPRSRERHDRAKVQTALILDALDDRSGSGCTIAPDRPGCAETFMLRSKGPPTEVELDVSLLWFPQDRRGRSTVCRIERTLRVPLASTDLGALNAALGRPVPLRALGE